MIYEAEVRACPHCKGSIDIRNPTGDCDHLCYPEYCDVCKTKTAIPANPQEKRTLEERARYFYDWLASRKIVGYGYRRVFQKRCEEQLTQACAEAFLDGQAVMRTRAADRVKTYHNNDSNILRMVEEDIRALPLEPPK